MSANRNARTFDCQLDPSRIRWIGAFGDSYDIVGLVVLSSPEQASGQRQAAGHEARDVPLRSQCGAHCVEYRFCLVERSKIKRRDACEYRHVRQHIVVASVERVRPGIAKY